LPNEEGVVVAPLPPLSLQYKIRIAARRSLESRGADGRSDQQKDASRGGWLVVIVASWPFIMPYDGHI
jgi:hypothetical protein